MKKSCPICDIKVEEEIMSCPQCGHDFYFIYKKDEAKTEEELEEAESGARVPYRCYAF